MARSARPIIPPLAIRAVKVAAAHSPCVREPPAYSGFMATSTAAPPAAARISRPSGAAGRSARAVGIPQAPVTAKAGLVTQRPAAPGSVRVLTVLASQLKEVGCSAVAAVHPPTTAMKAAAAEMMPHQGTEPGVSGQSSETVMATSMLPRVAFEYGHTW